MCVVRMKYILICIVLMGVSVATIHGEVISPDHITIQIPNDEAPAKRDGFSALAVS